MKKFVFAVVFAVAVVFAFNFAVVGVSSANDKGPAEIILKAEKGTKPATFPHADHQAKNPCTECHHSKGADGKKAAYVEGQDIAKCSTCHNADLANEKLNSFKKAAHVRCKGCHKAKKAEGASTKCGTCHKK